MSHLQEKDANWSGGNFSKQNLRRNAESTMEGADHADAQRAFAVENFGNPVHPRNVRKEVTRASLFAQR